MANTNPPESYPISVRVPNQATSSGGTPLNQPVDVSMTPSRMPTRATPLLPVDGGPRQAPSNVSTPSGAGGSYPANVNAPAAVPSSNGFPRRGQ
jgi:hypothetical protein